MTDQKVFVASDEAKAKAGQFRLFAVLAWLIAIAGEVFAIYKIYHIAKGESILTFLIIAIVIILILAVVGNLLWKKAGRLDPPSEKNQVEFFLKSQLGAILSVAAFLPLVIVIFTNKNMDGKTKGIAGAVGIVALLIATITGMNLNPPSQEKYTEQINAQTDSIKQLNNGVDRVYWTAKAGNKYHIYSDCQHIKGREISEGTVKQAWESRHIENGELCATCKAKALKEKESSNGNVLEQVKDALTTDSVK